MKTYSVGICDKDSDYTGALTDYVNCRKKLGLRLYSFTGVKSIKDYLKDENLDLIITDDLHGFSKTEDGYEYMGIKTVLLSESGYESDGVDPEDESSVFIYKYQKAEKICKQIRDMLRIEKKDVRQVASTVAVYSPLGRCGKTTFAKALAQSDEVRGGLYVAMENFGTDVSGLESNLLYLIKTRSTRLEEALVQQIKYEDGIYTLQLSGTFLDTHDVDVSDMDRLRTGLLQLGRYSTIVFDIGSAALRDLKILDTFDRLYVPVLRDGISTAKFEVFMKLLKDMDMRSVITRIITVDVPDVPFNSAEMTKKLWEIRRDENGDY